MFQNQPFSNLSSILVIMFIGTPNLTTLSLPYLLEEILEMVRPVLSSSQISFFSFFLLIWSVSFLWFS